MAKMTFDAKAVQSLLQKRKIATLEELKEALGSSSTMTVFRKLKPLGVSDQLFAPRQVLHAAGNTAF